MVLKFNLLISAALTPSLCVDGRPVLICLMLSHKDNSIVSCVCSVGGTLANARIRAEITAWAQLKPGKLSCPFFSQGNLVVANSQLDLIRFDEWHSNTGGAKGLASKYLDKSPVTMFLYFLYNRPMNCYSQYYLSDFSLKLFKRLVASAAAEYSKWLKTIS